MAVLATVAIGTESQGQLASSKGNIGAAVAAGQAWVDVVLELANLNTTDEVVTIYKKISGGSSKIVWYGTLLASNGTAAIPLGDMTAGDQLEAFTTTASKVDYTLRRKAVSVT